MTRYIATEDGATVLLIAVVRQAWRDAQRGQRDAVQFIRQLQAEHCNTDTPDVDIFRHGAAPRGRGRRPGPG